MIRRVYYGNRISSCDCSIDRRGRRDRYRYGDIRSTMLIGCALAEATAIYGLLVAIMLIFVADPGSNSVLGAAIAVVTGMGAGSGIGFATSRA